MCDSINITLFVLVNNTNSVEKCIYFGEIPGDGRLHIFIKLKDISSRKVLEKCCEKGVIFTPGDIFYTDDSGDDALRLEFSRVSKEEIEKGFKIIGEAVDSFS